MSKDLLYKVKGNAGYITINREPKRNAISQGMINEFLHVLETAERDENLRALCITGAGDKAFCSGADLGITLSGQDGDPLSGPRNYARLIKRMYSFSLPMVARVNGACLAGGLGLMLSCDIVIARDDAVFFTPEVNVGIFPMMVGALLYRNVGRKKAMDMVLTARRIAATEGERIGLISRAVPADELDQEIAATMNGLVSKSPAGNRIGKEAFRAMSDMPFDEAVDFLCEALGRAISTEDAKEGMKAFLEKREPVFKGK